MLRFARVLPQSEEGASVSLPRAGFQAGYGAAGEGHLGGPPVDSLNTLEAWWVLGSLGIWIQCHLLQLEQITAFIYDNKTSQTDASVQIILNPEFSLAWSKGMAQWGSVGLACSQARGSRLSASCSLRQHIY